MVREKVTIINPTGLHLRPAGRLCDTAGKYKSKITLRKGSKAANAKSLLAVLGCCIKTGDEVEFICEGEDEVEALEAVIHLIRNGLGE